MSFNIERKSVRFNLTPFIINESDDKAQDLQEARKSDFMQRKADAARFDRLLSSIFALEHRTKIWHKLYNT